MSDTATPTQEQPPPPPGDLPPEAETGTPRIIGGVAATLADGLGIDALWIRIGFVLLALVGGFGLVVYGALWLVLVAGPAWGTRAPVIAGGAVLVVGLPILLGGFSLPQSVVVVALLAGVAVALWQPRPAVPPTPTPRPPAEWHPFATHAEEVHRRVRQPARRRDPSPLGAITLGVAMVVAAGIALVDHVNGGRLHPEVWHGAAAVVCGIGLLVGTVRGHARWLVVPAVVLAGMGVLAGEMARLELGAGDVTGDRYVWVGEDTSGPISVQTGMGVARVQIGAVPAEPVAVDARVAVGRISVNANDAVAVDVRRDGGAPTRIGRADGPADVVVDARVGIGGVRLGEWTEMDETFDDGFVEPIPGRPEGLGALSPVTDLVAMTDDGWFVLADGEAVIDDQNRLAFGESWEDGDVSRLSTSYGEFTILPRGLLLTPDLEVIDLQAIRAEQAEAETGPQIDPSLVTIPPPPGPDPQGDLP